MRTDKKLHCWKWGNEKNIFMDKQSGKDFERPAYLKLLKKLKEVERRNLAYGSDQCENL